jgi:hypothetical protein
MKEKKHRFVLLKIIFVVRLIFRKMKQLLIVPICFIFFALANGQEAAGLAGEFISNSLKGQTSPDQIKKLDSYSLKNILQACSKPLSDSSTDVRKAAYELVYIMSLRKQDDSQVTRTVNILLSGCKDKESAIVYSNLKYLKYFKSGAFDAEARIKLAQIAREGTSYQDLVIRLTGLAGISDLIYDYSEMLEQKKYTSNKMRWALHLALARLGNAEEATYCVTKVKQMSVSDDVVYELLPDLAYTRTKEAFDYMLEIIKSNEKSCSSSNPDLEAKIICAYRVIQIVAPYINEFPVKVDKTGDIIATNYEQMLATVRQWIENNKSTYTLNQQIY